MESVGFLSMGGYSMSLILTREALSNQIAGWFGDKEYNRDWLKVRWNGCCCNWYSGKRYCYVRNLTSCRDWCSYPQRRRLYRRLSSQVNQRCCWPCQHRTLHRQSQNHRKRPCNPRHPAWPDPCQPVGSQDNYSDYGIVALPKNATGNLKMKREGLTAGEWWRMGRGFLGWDDWVDSYRASIISAYWYGEHLYIHYLKNYVTRACIW